MPALANHVPTPPRRVVPIAVALFVLLGISDLNFIAHYHERCVKFLSNLAVVHRISRGAISYCAESIDAERIPARLRGFRTIFTSFHHFPPDQAAAILQNAIDNEQGIGIFEAPRRRPFCILLTFLMPLAALLMIPLIRPFRLSLIVWTYVIPVIPFVLWFDGVLSCLRAYSLAELSQLISRLRTNHYKWEVGEKFGWLSPVTYLLGYPDPKNSQLGLVGRNCHEEVNT